MIGLLGKKVGMAQLFDEEGRQIPVTVLEVGPCCVTAVRQKDKHGYSAVQLAFDAAKESRLTRPERGQFKKRQIPCHKYVREIRTEDVEGLKVGGWLDADNFEVGDFVDVEGVSIGKGFQGVVKRHHFKGGASKSHGSMFGRVPGSIGASSFPSRVVKGLRAAGRMGNEKVTLQNLKVMKVDGKNHLLAVKGSVPGVEDGYLVVRMALKRGKARKWKLAAGTEGATSAQEAPKSSGTTPQEASAESSTPETSEEKS